MPSVWVIKQEDVEGDFYMSVAFVNEDDARKHADDLNADENFGPPYEVEEWDVYDRAPVRVPFVHLWRRYDRNGQLVFEDKRESHVWDYANVEWDTPAHYQILAPHPMQPEPLVQVMAFDQTSGHAAQKIDKQYKSAMGSLKAWIRQRVGK